MNNHSDMKKFITKRATTVLVQTELGTSVKVTKSQAGKLLDTLARRGVLPRLDCTEVRPMKYLVIIESGVGGIYCE